MEDVPRPSRNGPRRAACKEAAGLKGVRGAGSQLSEGSGDVPGCVENDSARGLARGPRPGRELADAASAAVRSDAHVDA